MFKAALGFLSEGKVNRDTYLAGLWESDLRDLLSWTASQRRRQKVALCAAKKCFLKRCTSGFSTSGFHFNCFFSPKLFYYTLYLERTRLSEYNSSLVYIIDILSHNSRIL
jgi:hypothetical protein